MPNPLDPIWKAHGITLDAYSVVRRSLQLPPAERAASLQGGQFAAAVNDQEILDALDAAEDELDDQSVMFLYATVEATLRDHVTGHGVLLFPAAVPGPQFGSSLQAWFIELCKDTRMDKVVGLFEPWAGQVGVAQAGSIRKYRHWLAHGKRGAVPQAVTPQFAYTSLMQFLQSCGLT
jgi:hypothetical protein